MSEHENAPAAPPEGEAEAILRRKEVRQPCSGKRPAIYLSVTEAAATARAERAERLYEEAKAIVAQSELAERLAQAEAERLRGERADLQHKLAHWQRVAEESGAMAARRVEAMREAAAVHTQEYLVSCGVTDACDVAEEVADAIRALPAPSPGPSAEDALREWLDRDAWSFLRRLLEQGRAIEQDNQAGRYPTYEHLSARLDEAARERRVELIAALGRKGEA